MTFWRLGILTALALAVFDLAASAQDRTPLSYTVATPRPVSPAEGTTTPSAQATQRQNPYLGSVPSSPSGQNIALSLQGALGLGLRYNLGLIESGEASAGVRAERVRALSALLPQIDAHARQAYENLSYKEIGLKLPPIPGLPSLPSTSGGFGYQDVRIGLSQNLFNAGLRNRYRARQSEEQASVFSIHDSRDVVVLSVATAYIQVVASAARVETARAQLASAKELDQQIASRVNAEVSPEIDSLRAKVQRQSAEQRLTNVLNQFEKDKLTLARIVGFSIDQQFTVINPSAQYPPAEAATASATEDALRSRDDLRSAEASVRAAEFNLRAQKAQRLPIFSVSADYGSAGTNVGNFNQVYSVAANVSLPIYTGGRIGADIQSAQSELARREAEFQDLKGRVAYDIRIALLDVAASTSSVKVAEQNKVLAQRAFTQSQDRYTNGVANYLEVVQAQEALTVASDNYIQSVFSYDSSLIAYARALGGAEARLVDLLGGK